MEPARAEVVRPTDPLEIPDALSSGSYLEIIWKRSGPDDRRARTAHTGPAYLGTRVPALIRLLVEWRS